MSRPSQRQSSRPVGCAPMPGAAPWGSSLSPLTGGRQTNQVANTGRIATLYNATVPIGVTPWNYYSGGIILENTVRGAEMVTAEGGPVSMVATVNALAVTGEITALAPSILPTERARVQSEGAPFTRLQAVIEFSTGTGTNETIVIDVDGGVVFRTFGTVSRVHYLTFPQGELGSSTTQPTSRQIFDNAPLEFPGAVGSQTSVDVIQGSVQTSKNRAEGFPSIWKCSAAIGNTIQECFVPPFSRFVNVQQAPTGTRIATYEFLNSANQVISSIDALPGVRQTGQQVVPGGARKLRVQPGAIIAPTTGMAVFGVGQF